MDRNYHFSRYGEIDIIALDKNTLCFIEVKTRSSNAFGAPLEAITRTKLDKIRKSALSYLQNSKIFYKNYRIDAISVFLQNTESKPQIIHIKNIEF